MTMIMILTAEMNRMIMIMIMILTDEVNRMTMIMFLTAEGR